MVMTESANKKHVSASRSSLRFRVRVRERMLA
jgi:hypothetical protein